jgi:hypothetical protein
MLLVFVVRYLLGEPRIRRLKLKLHMHYKNLKDLLQLTESQ